MWCSFEDEKVIDILIESETTLERSVKENDAFVDDSEAGSPN
jgi:hypothetical protein